MVAVTQGDLYGIAGVYGYVICVFVTVWLLRNRVENVRKLVHVFTGGIVFFWWTFDSRLVMAGLGAFPFTIILLLLATPLSPFEFLKKSPLGARSMEGHPYGPFLYAVSWTIIAYVFFDDLYAASIAIAAMSFGDGLGEVIGRKYGRIHYMPHRTVEGSAAVFIATLVSILVLYWFYFDVIDYTLSTPPALLWLFAPIMAFFVTFLEAIIPGSVDNLVLPLVVAGFLSMMGV